MDGIRQAIYRYYLSEEYKVLIFMQEVIGEKGLTPRAKKVIELAVDEARGMGHHYIGTEHMLLGLLREGQGVAADVLQKLNVSLEQARTQVVQILAKVDTGKSEPETPGE